MEDKLTLAIACGGTGGHLFPGIAVAQELLRRGHRVILLISEKAVDQEASAKYKELDFRVIPAIAKPPLLSLKMIVFLLKLHKTIGVCKKLFREEGVNVVLGMGGFTSFAPIYAAHKLSLRTYIHDSNAVPGKSNLMTSRHCNKVLLGLEAAKTYFPKGKAELVGTPVRAELKCLPRREDVVEKLWGFSPQKPVVFVFGGSQGARTLNTVVLEASKLLAGDAQFLHVSGTEDYERITSEAKGVVWHKVLAFCNDMPSAYAVADFVICRSGASSLAEVSWLGLPSFLVPYPYAADDHQTANARVFSDVGAAIMKKQEQISGSALAEILNELFSHPEQIMALRAACKRITIRDSEVRIADHLTNFVTTHPF